MSENLKHQLRSQVFLAHQEGASKRAAGEERAEKIYSYGSRNQLLDRVNDFCKSLPKEIRSPDQLTVTHVTDYLDKKAKTCTQATVDEYRAELKKIGNIIGVNLRCERVYADRTRSLNRGSGSVISKEDWGRILDYTREHPSSSGACLQLEALIGVRVSDMAYGIRIEADRLCIRSKNGRMAYRSITPEIRGVLNSSEFKKLIHGDRVIAPKDNSINKYLSRLQDRLGMEKHSFHDIRRRIAQDRYDEFRHMGMGRSEALSAVSSWLNHGSHREAMVLRSYIGNAW